MAFVPVHRYFNGTTNDHFYTTNGGEIGTTNKGQTGNHGFTSEGDAFYVSSVHFPGLVPIYRYFSDSTHDHLYTTNAGEIGTTEVGHAGNHGYKYEGVLGYVASQHIPGTVPIHRYYQGEKHDHFYTTDGGEIGTTEVGHTGHHGFKYEGVLGYAWGGINVGLFVPLYRYHNGDLHDHFYTTNAGEIGTTESGHKGNNGYTSEGIAFHVFAHPLPGLVPIHRYWNGTTHDHFYTTNAGEIGTTEVGHAGNHGYTYESTQGYVSPNHVPGSVPVHRYFNATTNDHLYTTNAGEIGTTEVGHAGNHGYKYEGVLGYVFPQ